MQKAKVFKSGNSQAIRIPKESQTDKSEFYIHKFGDVLILFPTDDPWYPIKASIGSFSDDAFDDFNRPDWSAIEKREEL